MVNDSNTPGHNDIVTDVDSCVTHKVACSKVTTVANADFALQTVKVDSTANN